MTGDQYCFFSPILEVLKEDYDIYMSIFDLIHIIMNQIMDHNVQYAAYQNRDLQTLIKDKTEFCEYSDTDVVYVCIVVTADALTCIR